MTLFGKFNFGVQCLVCIIITIIEKADIYLVIA